MATRFSCSFPSIKGVTFAVTIDDSAGGSPVVVDAASDGFTLSYDGTEDVLCPIIGSRVEFTIAVTSATESAVQAFANDLITSAEQRFTMKITRDDGGGAALFWVGYVLPDLSGFEDHEPPYGFRVSATDGIARLKNEKYDNGADPAEPVGAVSFLTHILSCLKKGTLHTTYYGATDIFLATSVNWVDATIGTPTATKCPLAYTRVNGEAFARRGNDVSAEEWEFDDCHKVLTKILENWQCRLYYAEGRYRVEQIAERSNDFFFERRFSYDGTLRSSSSALSNDLTIQQGSVNEKLAGNLFNYVPAIKSARATWEHLTIKNQLAGAGGKWIGGSGQPQTVTLTNVTTDANTRFIFTAGIGMEVDLGAAYTGPWRYVIGVRIIKDGQYIKSNTFSVQNGSGQYLQQVGQDPLTWNGSLSAYEISSDFSTTDTINFTKTVNFEIGNIPTTGSTIQIVFVPIGAFELDDDAMLSPVLLNWTVKAPQLYILDSTDNDTFVENARVYLAENASVGNSDYIDFDLSFGSAVQGWTISRLQTTSNLTTWTDSGSTWDRGTGTTNVEFGKLWVNQAMALRNYPAKTYRGQFFSKTAQAHHRLVFDFDDSAWLLINGRFSAREHIWDGTWVSAGINETDVSTFPIRKKIGGISTGPFFVDPNQPPSAFNSKSIGVGSTLADINLMTNTAGFVGATIAAGSVTSVPLRDSVPAGSYIAGDNIFVYNPSNGQAYPMTVSVTPGAGDTSLSVTANTIGEAIPIGGIVLWSSLNRFTQTGGDPSLILPPGTAEGQVLRWDSTSDIWEPYSGTTDGYVLTWDTTNGWQAEVASAPTITLTGDVTGTGTSTVSTLIANNVVTNTKLRDSAGLSVIGRDTNTTGDPADVVAFVDGAVLRRSGTGIGFGEVATAGLANDAVTYAKIQNVTDARLLGRSAGSNGDVQEITVGTGLSLSGGALTNTVTAGVTGSGVANRLAIWTGTSTLGSDDSPLWFDGTNNRLGINTASPASVLHVGLATGTTDEGLRVLGNLSANLNNTISNVNNTNAAANAILQIVVGGINAGDPLMQYSVSSGATLSMGIDNSDLDKFKFKFAPTPSSTPSNNGMTLYSNETMKVGINIDAPLHDLDVAATARARTFHNTVAAPTVTPGTGMGTSPTGISVSGGGNCMLYSFTTGTGPSANATIFTITPATGSTTKLFATLSPSNAQAATDIAKFRISATTATTITVTANGTLSASTAYSLFFIFLGN